MKKVLYLIITIILFNPVLSYATNNEILNNIEQEQKSNNKEEVYLEECIDISTVKIRNSSNEILKVKLFAITDATDEDILVEGKKYVCNMLVSANKITIEYNEDDKEDSYGRKLVWLFINDKLLQNEIVVNGYAKVNDLYDKYKYIAMLQDSEIEAKRNKVGVWKVREEIVNSEIQEPEKKKKNFFQELFDNICGAIVKFIDDILEKILNLIEDML